MRMRFLCALVLQAMVTHAANGTAQATRTVGPDNTIDDLIVIINSTDDPTTPAFSVGGPLNLSGSLTIVATGVPFPAGVTYLIIENDGTDPINGTLDGVAEGTVVVANGQRFRVSYTGGSGNDFTLTALAEIAVPTLSGAALTALVAMMVLFALLRLK